MWKSVIHNGQPVYYRDKGKGDVVVLLHGFGETGDVWDQQAAVLASHFRLLIPDLPGSGRSGITEDMSMEGLADVLFHLLNHENIPRCVLIGHSMGGYVALAFAANYGGYLRGLGLFHSTAYADSEEKKQVRQKGIGFIEEHGAFAFLKTSSPNLFSTLTREKQPELVDEFVERLSDFSASALVLYYKSMMARADHTQVLREAAYPILFVMGPYDQAVPMADSLRLCTLPGKSYIYTLTSSGHMGMLEQPGLSGKIILQFSSEAYLF